MNALWPPIDSIAKRLFTPADVLLRRIAARDSSVPEDVRSAIESDPEWLAQVDALRDTTLDALETPDDVFRGTVTLDASMQDCIARLVDFRQCSFTPTPQAGQIVRIDRALDASNREIDTNIGPGLAVLLTEPTDIEGVWVGWIVASESSYAASWDLLLQTADEPFHPSVSMVQAWNVVHVYLPTVSSVLGQLSELRFAAVCGLALDAVRGDEEPLTSCQPGRVVTRRTTSGHSVETGTPLSGPADPRWRYQQIYFAAAEMVRMSARHATSPARVSAGIAAQQPAAKALDGEAESPSRSSSVRVLDALFRPLRPIRSFLSSGLLPGTPNAWSLAGADHGRVAQPTTPPKEIVLVQFESYADASPPIELVAVMDTGATSIELRGLSREEATTYSSLRLGDQAFPLQLDNRKLIVVGHQMMIRRSLAAALASDSENAVCLA